MPAGSMSSRLRPGPVGGNRLVAGSYWCSEAVASLRWGGARGSRGSTARSRRAFRATPFQSPGRFVQLDQAEVRMPGVAVARGQASRAAMLGLGIERRRRRRWRVTTSAFPRGLVVREEGFSRSEGASASLLPLLLFNEHRGVVVASPEMLFSWVLKPVGKDLRVGPGREDPGSSQVALEGGEVFGPVACERGKIVVQLF